MKLFIAAILLVASCFVGSSALAQEVDPRIAAAEAKAVAAELRAEAAEAKAAAAEAVAKAELRAETAEAKLAGVGTPWWAYLLNFLGAACLPLGILCGFYCKQEWEEMIPPLPEGFQKVLRHKLFRIPVWGICVIILITPLARFAGIMVAVATITVLMKREVAKLPARQHHEQ